MQILLMLHLPMKMIRKHELTKSNTNTADVTSAYKYDNKNADTVDVTLAYEDDKKTDLVL